MNSSYSAESVIAELNDCASAQDAVFLQKFFKTAKGQYGYGDIFIGVRVPQTRTVCRKYKNLQLSEIKKLLTSRVHEHRLAGLIIMSNQSQYANENERKELYDIYITMLHNGYINNWDLVDTSAGYVVGNYLIGKEKHILYQLAKSDQLWERRVSIIATFSFIKNGEAAETLKIAELLLHDSHDLIHKAAGWMLREVGKRVDREVLERFLNRHAHEMPRTMLRYAIEHLPTTARKNYMSM
jgi:3-methyladenine DNA glycosylase AlkD